MSGKAKIIMSLKENDIALEAEKEALISNLTSEDEEKLRDYHEEKYEGLDDEMSDNYENFLEELSPDEIKNIIK